MFSFSQFLGSLTIDLKIVKVEIAAGQRKQSHFTRIVDPSEKHTFLFLVMQLVFTVPTSVGGVMQCPEACEDLQHGFIHRDLMPPITHVVPETGNE
ncbi:hypothetical protein KIN20_030750, partial [Parelaphostrongylus tenuis]